MTRARQRMLTAVGVILSALFLWLALRGADAPGIWQVMRQTRLWMIAPFLLLLFAYYWTKALRWQTLLAPMRHAPVGKLFPPIMIGYAGSMILPMQLGELVRVFVAGRTLTLSATPLLSSIALERLLDFLSLLLLVGVALIAGSDVPPALVTAGWIIGIAGVTTLGIAVAYIVWTSRVTAMVRTFTGFLPAKVQEQLLHQVEMGAQGLYALRSARALAKVMVLSLVQWGFMWGCIYISLAALDLQVPMAAVFITLAFTVIGVTLPTSPGYIGSIQLAYAWALEPYGVTPDAAFASSVFFHVLANASVIVVGLYYLQRLGYTVRDLREQSGQKIPDQQG